MVQSQYVRRMPLSQLANFAIAAFLIIVVPGPSVLFVITRGVALGRRAAVITVVGNTVGALLLAWLVAFGLGSIITASVLVFNAVKLTGAAYLVFLGVQMWRTRHELPGALSGEVEPKSLPTIFREGFVVGVTNPKVVVFFGAVLPQFVDRSAGRVPMQMGVLGLVFALIAFVSDSAWGLAAGTVRQWFTRRPERLARVGGVGGIVIVGLGVRLAVTGRHD
jgi:threonine/homoserine/homoserine lactone efflux protein